MTKYMFLINHNIANSLVSTPTSLPPLLKTQNPGRELPIGQARVAFLPQLKRTVEGTPVGLLPSMRKVTRKAFPQPEADALLERGIGCKVAKNNKRPDMDSV